MVQNEIMLDHFDPEFLDRIRRFGVCTGCRTSGNLHIVTRHGRSVAKCYRCATELWAGCYHHYHNDYYHTDMFRIYLRPEESKD